MTKHETTSETVDSSDSDAVVAPFKQDKAPHHITVGKSRTGSTFSTKHQRFAEMFEDEGDSDEDDSRTHIIIDPKGDELTEIEEVEDLEDVDLESVNPLDLSNESVDESKYQSTNGEDNS